MNELKRRKKKQKRKKKIFEIYKNIKYILFIKIK